MMVRSSGGMAVGIRFYMVMGVAELALSDRLTGRKVERALSPVSPCPGGTARAALLRGGWGTFASLYQSLQALHIPAIVPWLVNRGFRDKSCGLQLRVVQQAPEWLQSD